MGRTALKRVVEVGIGLYHALVLETPDYKARWVTKWMFANHTFLAYPCTALNNFQQQKDREDVVIQGIAGKNKAAERMDFDKLVYDGSAKSLSYTFLNKRTLNLTTRTNE